jgi:F0F1-type ATP synthase delta subunit
MPLSRTLALYMAHGKASLDDVIVLLTKYKLLNLLPSVKKALIQISSDVHKKDTILVESPFALSPHSVEKIKGIVGDTKAPLEVIINKKILAGFKAKFQGMMYDGSAERIVRQITNQ